MFDAICEERIINDYLQSAKGARILRENICYWVSRRNFPLDLLSIATAEAGPNLLVTAIDGAVRQVIKENLRLQLDDIDSDVLRSEASSIIADILRIKGAELIWNSLREQVNDTVCASLLVQAVKIVRNSVQEEFDDVVMCVVGLLLLPRPRE